MFQKLQTDSLNSKQKADILLKETTALAVFNLLIGLAIGYSTGLAEPNSGEIVQSIQLYWVTAIIAIPLGTVVAFLALAGKGYLASRCHNIGPCISDCCHRIRLLFSVVCPMSLTAVQVANLKRNLIHSVTVYSYLHRLQAIWPH
jgi:ABC-type arginine transport system permease subunit